MIIEKEKTLIPACDVTPKRFEILVKETAAIPEIGAYKIGFMLGLTIGLPKTCEIARKYTDKPLIYDHQKAGTDIPDTGWPFMEICKKAGINAVILFPQAGIETERTWIAAAKEHNLGVIVGGLMTHKGYTRAEGGFLADEAVLDMYLAAVKFGVNDFVVPGTKPEAIHKIRVTLENIGVEPTFYSPGLVTQKGNISEALAAAGSRWHAIIGRAIYEADDMQKAASDLARLIK
ncbi:MAG: orotidine 5'-phosphate decarboxylase / HUMPS family protein [Pseudomonadota bacterium]